MKRALVLAHHNRVELTTSVRGGGQQCCSLRTFPPRPPARHTHIEELRNHRADTVDQLLQHRTLPRTRRLNVLKRARRHPAVEREAKASLLGWWRATAMARHRGEQFSVRQPGHDQLP